MAFSVHRSPQVRYFVGQIYHYGPTIKGFATLIDWLHGMFNI